MRGVTKCNKTINSLSNEKALRIQGFLLSIYCGRWDLKNEKSANTLIERLSVYLYQACSKTCSKELVNTTLPVPFFFFLPAGYSFKDKIEFEKHHGCSAEEDKEDAFERALVTKNKAI